ncbi:citramalate synthase [candidate division MSBL1 archaeon SCGC-AAA259A05]|uniref:2-isopropylmalate synthase n=1 Tax=candidate division MSBL1 archaeon SCGC-AAA259A05 TaxID=1698259 RepID=A0A133UAX8_9EURY|nr:citramalate synthase [candidate division MSBL1 archaeon SCGC-AAA259A05]
MNNKGYISKFTEAYKEKLKLPDRVKIFDTTLRDGEGTPGVSFTPEQKLLIARQLDKLGVDIIEAGSPISSKGERKAAEKIAGAGLNAEICALARCVGEDIETAIGCGVDSAHIYLATSDIHLKHKLGLTREEALEKAVESVEMAKDHDVIVEFSAEDATRTDLDYLKEIYGAVEEVGANRINIPDTVGVAAPEAMRKLIGEIKEVVELPISVHCHDDFGLAVSNTLASIEAGCEQTHVTINGLGERAGNASLEEVVMGLRALYGIKPNIQTEFLVEASDLIERISGITIPPNKAIVGDNAFAHETGVHAHGVVKFPGTYEPISPESVGHRRRLDLGKLTGKHSVEKQLEDMGIEVSPKQVKDITKEIRKLGDKGKRVTDADLRAITESIVGELPEEEKAVELKEATVTTGSTVTPTSSIRLSFKGDERVGSATGVGPVDAAIKALRNVMSEIATLSLKEYHLDAITGGSDALADVTVKLKDENNNLYIAKGVRDDVVLASVEAMVNGINKYFASKK